jgi:putative membrane protein
VKLDAATSAAITTAVRKLEGGSCAEVVVEVRGRSGSYAHASARFAALAAFVALLVLLFSPWTFRAAWVAMDVAAAYAIALYAARRSDSVRQLMTTARERANVVRLGAAAAFYERGIANTEAETGVLLYLSLMERRMELLADRGVLAAVPSREWNQIAAHVRTRNATPATLIEALDSLGPLLAQRMPALAGDRDELCNEPRFLAE